MELDFNPVLFDCKVTAQQAVDALQLARRIVSHIKRYIETKEPYAIRLNEELKTTALQLVEASDDVEYWAQKLEEKASVHQWQEIGPMGPEDE